MTRGFQNTLYFWILLKSEGAKAQQNKANFFWVDLNTTSLRYLICYAAVGSLWHYSKVKVLLPSITKPIFCGTLWTLYTLVLVMISECKLNLLFPLSELHLVKFRKFQSPSWTEFLKFSGAPLTFDPDVILKVVIPNQRSIFGRPVLLWGTVQGVWREENISCFTWDRGNYFFWAHFA